jgi:5-formyltetrahydrofolate cyclo-ligase
LNTGLSFPELSVIFILLLLFFGSKELPRLIREGTRFWHKIRRYSEKVRRELDEISHSLDTPLDSGSENSDDRFSNDIFRKKRDVRQRYIAARKALTSEQRTEKSRAIWEHLKGDERYKTARSVMVYINTGAEVETKDAIEQMLENGKRVIVPYCCTGSRTMGIAEIKGIENDTTIGTHGILEPIDTLRDNFFKSDLQLIVCPGVAFDKYGGRLGIGGAYYDTFLHELKGRIPIIGIAFDCQIIDDAVPFDYHDISVEQIFSESGAQIPEFDEKGENPVSVAG